MCRFQEGGEVQLRDPDWEYRLDYLLPTRETIYSLSLPYSPASAGTSAEQRKKAAEIYHKAAGYYRSYSNKSSRQLVGVNNVSEITFDRLPDNTLQVNHTLRWHEPNLSVSITNYEVNLDFDHQAFDETKLKKWTEG